MSQVDKPFQFQSLRGKSIKFDATEQAIINGLSPLEGEEWDSEFKDTVNETYLVKEGSSVLRAHRNKLTTGIKQKLIDIQGKYCIYCGFHTEHCGNLEREHIAPKGRSLYPSFVFEPQNLCLACHRCNYELKRDSDVASGEKTDYAKNNFSIVHPYLDDIHEHLEFAVVKGRCVIKIKNGSEKGKETIKLFKLASAERTLLRSGLLMAEENEPSPEQDERLNKILNNKYLPKQRL